jgi:DNA gyrase subunit A
MFVHEDEDILLITDDGTIIRARAADVRLCGRSTQGVRIMRLAEGSTVVGVCRAEKEEETPEETTETPEGEEAGISVAEGSETVPAAEPAASEEKP